MQRERLEKAIKKVAKDHLFQKGEPRPEGAGRKKGQKNRMTILLKEAVIMAAEAEGDNHKGRDGLVGYLRILARREPAVFARLLEKLLPLQITGKDGGPMQMIHKTKEQILERFRERELPVPQSLKDMPTHSDTRQ